VVSIAAVLEGQPDVAVGNVVGSNIANLLLILGISASLAPIVVAPSTFRRDATSMVAATLLFLFVAATGAVSAVSAVGFLVACAAYLAWAYRSERRGSNSRMTSAEADEVFGAKLGIATTVLLLIVGFGLLLGGARVLLNGAVGLAEDFGVSTAVIGLTVVAVGTSLPELAVSLVAALRGRMDIAVGNVLGSNIFNLLAILGVAALVGPVPIHARILAFDQWVMLVATLVVTIFIYTRFRLERWEGALLLAGYATYLYFTFTHFAT
jgi:cation:H+ antiporter